MAKHSLRCGRAVALRRPLLAARLPAVVPGHPAGARSRTGSAPGLRRADHPAGGARLRDHREIASLRRSPQHGVRRAASALLVRATEFPGQRLLNAAHRPAGRGVAGRRRARPDPRLRPVRAGSAVGLTDAGIEIIYAVPGMVMATVFVSLPLVVRAVAPVLEEIGTEQEQAARPSVRQRSRPSAGSRCPTIRAAVAYGIVLSLARCIGEFGAVAVVVRARSSARPRRRRCSSQERYENYDQPAAYAAVVRPRDDARSSP